jgi:hypothetical protein
MTMTQATMTPTKLSLLAGATLMLAAFPAFAQTSSQTGGANANPGMTPRSSTGAPGSGMHGSSQGQDTHQATSPHHATRSGRTDASQNAAVDRLNAQSLQAAQQGQNFVPGSPGSGSAAPPSDNMGRSGGGMSGQSGGKM